MTDNFVEIEEGEHGVVVRNATEEVQVQKDPNVGDWQIHHFMPKGFGSPGGVRSRAQGIEYALYVLGVIEETDVRPQDPYAGM